MKWIKIISRTSSPLQWSAQIHQNKEGLTVGPLSWRYQRRLIIKYATPLAHLFVYTDGGALEVNIQDHIQSPNSEVDNALDNLEALIAKDLQLIPGNSLEDLRHFYNRFKYEMGQMIMAYDFAQVAREVLEKNIGKEKIEAMEKDVMQPYKETLFIQENRELVRARTEYQSSGLNKDYAEQQAIELAEKFGFLHAEYIGKPWSKENYYEEITAKGPSTALVKSTQAASYTNLDEYAQWLVKTIQRLIYIFDESKNALVRANWAFRETLRTLNIDEQPILNCTEEEFLEWLKTKKLLSKEVLDSRNNYYVARLWDGKIEEFSTQAEAKRIIKEEEIADFEAPEKGITELKGQVAYQGKVRGKVKVVFLPEDAEQVQEGDILVASMTTPGMIQGMRKAAAFVTDEGGVLCHAAIIAREFRKPCIIGTKKATVVFKNGDQVEVDANEGIVRIL